jgi:hypothetical protein
MKNWNGISAGRQPHRDQNCWALRHRAAPGLDAGLRMAHQLVVLGDHSGLTRSEENFVRTCSMAASPNLQQFSAMPAKDGVRKSRRI